MKKMWMVMAGLFVFALAVSVSTVKVQAECDGDNCVCQFIDEDGDGICDLCGGCLPQGDQNDADGDGIPNGQDDDFVPGEDGPKDGLGQKKGCR